MPREMTTADIENVFTYHKPLSGQPEIYENLRMKAKSLARSINVSCPESIEKSLAMTNLRQAVMWANASIACNEKP